MVYAVTWLLLLPLLLLASCLIAVVVGPVFKGRKSENLIQLFVSMPVHCMLACIRGLIMLTLLDPYEVTDVGLETAYSAC